jgi:hypothetical protein
VLNTLKTLEDSLQAILVYGGAVGQEIGLEIPEDETRLEELSLIFDEKYAGMSEDALKKETMNLNARYREELRRRKISELTEQLTQVESDEEKTMEILKQIEQLRKE